MAYIPRSERYNPAFKPSARHTVTPSKVYIQDFFEVRIVKQEHNTNRYQLQLNKKANRNALEKSLKLGVGLDLAHIGDPTELIDGVDLYSLITKIENPTLTFAPIDASGWNFSIIFLTPCEPSNKPISILVSDG